MAKSEPSAAAPSDNMITYTSGAKRSAEKPRYDLIPTIALRRLANRYELGASKYGEYNWAKGLPLEDTINHIIDHLVQYRDRMVKLKRHNGLTPLVLKDTNARHDDDLAGAMWGCSTLMALEEKGKLL